MDNALYPVLFLDYLKHSFPVFNLMMARIPALLGITLSLTYLNYRGLHIVGFTAVFLAVFSLSPFLVMAILSVPKVRPRRWFVVDFNKVNWRGYFNNMFWNLNYWDKASTLVGEVENPGKTFPKALFGGLVLVVCSYLIPLLAGTGALSSSPTEWADGYFAQVGMLIGGFWLRLWIQAAAAMSNLGLFEAEMISDAFQLLGMSKMGLLPAFFASRSKYGTPTVSILFSATGVIFLSWMSFQQIVEFLNFLYAIGMLVEFAAFITLRLKKPDLCRPYRVPLQTFWAAMLCLPPASLLILVMCLASLRTIFVSAAVVIFRFILYPILIQAKDKNWLLFETEQVSSPSSGWQECIPIVSELVDLIQQCNPQINIESIEDLLGLSHGDANSSPKDIRPQMHSSTSTHAPCHGKQCINEDVEKDDINDEIQEDDINDKIQEDDLNDKIQEDDVDDEFQEDDIDLDDEFQEEDIDGEFQEDDVDEEFMEDDISNEFQEDDLDALLLEDKLE